MSSLVEHILSQYLPTYY